MQWALPISSDDVITMQKPISTTTTSRSIKGHKVCVMRIDGVLTSMGVLVARILARDEGADSLACYRTGGRQCARLLRKP